jgi:hypothetical protein
VEALVLRDETSIIDVAWAPQLGRSYGRVPFAHHSFHQTTVALLAAWHVPHQMAPAHTLAGQRRVDQHRDAFGRDARACGRLH